MDIIVDVLRVINQGAHKPTNIMYRANLSWVPLSKLLDILVARELVIMEEHNHREATKRLYDITRKGRAIMHSYNAIAGSVSERPVPSGLKVIAE